MFDKICNREFHKYRKISNDVHAANIAIFVSYDFTILRTLKVISILYEVLFVNYFLFLECDKHCYHNIFHKVSGNQ